MFHCDYYYYYFLSRYTLSLSELGIKNMGYPVHNVPKITFFVFPIDVFVTLTIIKIEERIIIKNKYICYIKEFKINSKQCLFESKYPVFSKNKILFLKIN